MSARRSPLTRPRGRLPRRVYWFRRMLVLGTALAMVYGIAHLLGAGSGGGSGDTRATITAAHPQPPGTPAPTGFVGPLAVATENPADHQGDAASATAAPQVPLATPSGPCVPADVTVQPEVTTAAAGGPITLRLRLTGTQPACSFTVSPRTVVLKVTSGNDRIWSSQDCPRAIPTQTVAVRSAVSTSVPVTWSGRRSDGTCSHSSAWAEPGYYHALAAALGSEPSDVQFRLTLPSRPVITRTAKPRQHHARSSSASSPSPSPSAGASPSGHVDGKQSACGGDNAC